MSTQYFTGSCFSFRSTTITSEYLISYNFVEKAFVIFSEAIDQMNKEVVLGR